MHRHLGRRPGRAALTIVAALAVLMTLAFAGRASRATKHVTTAPKPAPAAPAAPISVARMTPAQTTHAVKPAAEPNATPARAAGMVVGIDPETGRPGMPSAGQRAALDRSAFASPSIDRSDVGLRVVHKPDGSKMIDLQGRFQEYAIVKIGPDGKKTESCVQGPNVEAALKGDAAAANGSTSASAQAAPSDPASNAPTPETPPSTER